MSPHKQKFMLLLIVGTALLLALLLFMLPAIPQSQAYHQFADGCAHVGIPNFYNVMSNLPFLIAGGLPLQFALRKLSKGGLSETQRLISIPYMTAFFGVMLVAFGSAYYHLSPDNESLVWDRIPMTIAFTAFFCAVVSEKIELRSGLKLLLPLLVLGIFSVLYWYYTELQGRGDMRLYVWIQFAPMILVPMMVWLLPGGLYGTRKNLILIILFYALAKVAEHFDAQIFQITASHFSGHSLKHVLAAVASWYIFECYRLHFVETPIPDARVE